MANKYAAITSFTEDGINFCRVGDHFGWYIQKDGNQYGDYLLITDDKITEETVNDTFSLLKDQAQSTIKQLS